MPPESRTIGQVADLLASKFGDFSDSYYARQIRHHVQLGVYAPHKRTGEGRTAAALFRHDDVAMIRLVGILARIGLSPTLLAEAAKSRENVALPVGKQVGAGINAVLDGTASGEEWFFHFHIAVMEEGERGFGQFAQSRDVAPPRLLADHIVGTIVLPCLPLLKPLMVDD